MSTGESGGNTGYEDYMNQLADMMKSISGMEQLSSASALDIVITMCADERTLRLVSWNEPDGGQKIRKEQLFSEILEWLLQQEEVPDDKMEAFCHAGELLAAALQRGEDWVFFQKLRIDFFIENGSVKQALLKLVELEELLPADSFVKEARERLSGRISLEDITDFPFYLECLKNVSNRYIICIAAMDTPWGPGFTQELTHKMRILGLKQDLYNRFRCGYVAVIDCGEVIYEQLSSPQQKAAWSGMRRGMKFEIESRGYDIHPQVARIEINNRNYALNRRGLNIVVYDSKKDEVIDKVVFDTYVDSLSAYRPEELANALKKWHSEHPEIGVLCFNLPGFPQENLSPCERFIAENAITRQKSIQYAKRKDMPLRAFFNRTEDILEVLGTPQSYLDTSGVRRFKDIKGHLVNTVGGHRLTTDQPQKSKRSIYVLGGCIVFGVGVSDHGTIASWLQRLCNEKAGNEQFIVQNYGFFLAETDKEYMEEMRILKALPLQPGDIVLCNWGISSEFPLANLYEMVKRPHGYGDIFYDSMHLNENGHRVVAEKLFERLEQEQFFENLADSADGANTVSISLYGQPGESDSKGVKSQTREETAAALEDYKSKLQGLYDSRFSVGAIVMNCNPFTLGHRYLIEQAAKQCAHLVVFVVEEDLSFFPFADRLQLVKSGTEDLENVLVMPSGQFILSSLTFSEYFNKSEMQDRIVDASMDVQLFAKEIAPCLHITKRFVGDEPFDMVTRQYNNEMKKILPQYGIEVIQMERLKYDGTGAAISASEVRRCIEERDFRTIESMVPLTTYEYICAKFMEKETT